MNKERLSKLADWLEAGAPHEHVKIQHELVSSTYGRK